MHSPAGDMLSSPGLLFDQSPGLAHPGLSILTRRRTGKETTMKNLITAGLFAIITITNGRKAFNRLVDQAVARLENILGDQDVEHNLDFDESRTLCAVTIEIPEQQIDAETFEDILDVCAELCWLAGAGGVETLCEGKEEVHLFGFETDLAELKAFFEPAGAKAAVGFDGDEDKDLYESLVA